MVGGVFRSESRCQGPVDEGGISKGFYYTCFFDFLLRITEWEHNGEQAARGSSNDLKQWF